MYFKTFYFSIAIHKKKFKEKRIWLVFFLNTCVKENALNTVGSGQSESICNLVSHFPDFRFQIYHIVIFLFRNSFYIRYYMSKNV